MRGTGRIFINALLAFAAAGLSTPAAAAEPQADSVQKVVHHIGFNLRPAFIIQSHKFFRGENATGGRLWKSGAAHLQYSFSFPGESRYGKEYPTAYQGIGVGMNTFGDRQEIGNPASVYIFQGAQLARLSDKLSFDYEWNFGASFGWEPYNMVTNPNNTVVGSKVNAFINVGFLLTWRPSPGWNVSAGVDLTHFSNGNTRYPNSGVNTAGLRIGAVKNFGNMDSPRPTSSGASELAGKSFLQRTSLDVTVYGAGRAKGLYWNNNPYIVKGTFGIIGLNVNPLYKFNKFFKAGASLDVQYDECANIGSHVAGTDADGEIKFYRPPFAEQFGVGLSLRAEFCMPVFSVNLGFGRNFIYKGDELKGFYQILALKAEVYKGLYLHIGYKLHDFHDPNNLMLGFGWRFR